ENDDTGFSATTFRQGNQVVLAIRGTEAGQDQFWEDWITTNFNGIGNFGVAVDQAISLFNYIQRLRAPKGQAVLQLEMDYIGFPLTIGYKISTNTDGIGLGTLQLGDTIDVVGHSLGGHLAIVAKRLFPELINEVHTFNGANFNPFSEGFFTSVNEALEAVESDIRSADSFNEINANITRYISEDSAPGDDAEVVASAITGWIKPGQEILLRTEMNSHSVGQIADDLTIFKLLESLNPDLTMPVLTSLYDEVSSVAELTQETLVEKLSKLLLDNDSDIAVASASLASVGDFSGRSELQEKGDASILEHNGDNYAKEGESTGAKLPAPYSTERT
ncbi:MAG: hypothetical protein GY752_00480, partial [bacterium]|nr:hypothetical protein [bacterium]